MSCSLVHVQCNVKESVPCMSAWLSWKALIAKHRNALILFSLSARLLKSSLQAVCWECCSVLWKSLVLVFSIASIYIQRPFPIEHVFSLEFIHIVYHYAEIKPCQVYKAKTSIVRPALHDFSSLSTEQHTHNYLQSHQASLFNNSIQERRSFTESLFDYNN